MWFGSHTQDTLRKVQIIAYTHANDPITRLNVGKLSMSTTSTAVAPQLTIDLTEDNEKLQHIVKTHFLNARLLMYGLGKACLRQLNTALNIRPLIFRVSRERAYNLTVGKYKTPNYMRKHFVFSNVTE
uniref:Uncharacterized protein n=1 Tax=Romanomermis culicivorax TaxID=13658 RepID=A0A915L9V3_ROMCU